MSAEKPCYVIDTSALIDWWQDYAPDVFPGLLPLMEDLVVEERLCSVRYVREEIKDSDEDLTLAKWCKAQDGFYVEDDEAVQLRVRKLMAQFQVPKRPKGIGGADPFVIARAALNGPHWRVVSSERPALGNAHKNPNIPFVCNAVDVLHIRFLDMLRMEGWKLSHP